MIEIKWWHKYNTNVLKNQQGENIKICNLYSGDLYFRIIWRSRGYVCINVDSVTKIFHLKGNDVKIVNFVWKKMNVWVLPATGARQHSKASNVNMIILFSEIFKTIENLLKTWGGGDLQRVL